MGPAHDDLNVALDILGQQPLLQIYTQLTIAFAVSDDANHDTILQTLESGLSRASAAFPWIAGQVVNEGAGDGSTGTFKIKPLDAAPRLTIKDLRQDDTQPAMADFVDAGFPMSMLDEGFLASRKTLPGNVDGPKEVLSVQAVFIRGGLLLTFTHNHGTADAVGQGHVMELISKACRGDNFTSGELTTGNLPREHLVPLLDDSYEPGPELKDYLFSPAAAPAPPSSSASADPPPACSWASFDFSRESLAAIKEEATRSIPPGSAARFVSTDDALTAFVWKSVARARLPRLLSKTTSAGTLEVMLTRAVDMRTHFGVPPNYPGLLQTIWLHRHDLRRLTEAPLGILAADLRSPLLPSPPVDDDQRDSSARAAGVPSWDIVHLTRALTTYVARSADKSGASFTAAVNPDADLMISSWAKLGTGLNGIDFGLGLGLPLAVRRPRFEPFAGLAYFMPQAPDGSITLSISLRDDDMRRLRDDAEFARRAVYLG